MTQETRREIPADTARGIVQSLFNEEQRQNRGMVFLMDARQILRDVGERVGEAEEGVVVSSPSSIITISNSAIECKLTGVFEKNNPGQISAAKITISLSDKGEKLPENILFSLKRGQITNSLSAVNTALEVLRRMNEDFDARPIQRRPQPPQAF